MEIRSLIHTSVEDIVDCLLDAFSTYEIAMPTDIDYWKRRFRVARIDFNLSFGMFDQQKLVGFIIIGVDDIGGQKTAFNSGTGVRSPFRGQKIVDQLYEHAIPEFKKAAISRCTLEVLVNNERAIHVYKRIGFEITKTLHCFKRTAESFPVHSLPPPLTLKEVLSTFANRQAYYSWDNCAGAFLLDESGFAFHSLEENGRKLGYFVLYPAHKYVNQLEVINQDDAEAWSLAVESLNNCLAGLWKLNNIDSRRIKYVNALIDAGWDNYIDQYEMAMHI